MSLKFIPAPCHARAGERIILCAVDVIDASWHPALVARLQHCLKSVDTTSEPAGTAPTSITSAGSSEKNEAGGLATGRPATSAVATSAVDSHLALSVMITLRTLRLRLDKETEARSLMSLTVCDASVHYRKWEEFVAEDGGGGTIVEGRLGNLVATDACSPSTLYPEILGLYAHKEEDLGGAKDESEEGANAAQADLVRFTYTTVALRGAASADAAPAGCNLLALSVGPVQLVYLQQFILETLDYAFEGILGDAVWGSLAKAGALLRESLVATKTAFSVDLDSPRLVIPEHCASGRHMVAVLGVMQLRTAFHEKAFSVFRGAGPEEESLWFRTLSVSIAGIHLLGNALNLDPGRGGDGGGGDDGDDGNSAGKGALSFTKAPVHLSLEAVMPLDGHYAIALRDDFDVKGLANAFTGSLSRLTLCLDEPRYQLLVAVVKGNFGDQRRHGVEAPDGDPLPLDDSGAEAAAGFAAAASARAEGSAAGAAPSVTFNYGNAAVPVAEVSVALALGGVTIDLCFPAGNAPGNAQGNAWDEGGRARPGQAASLTLAMLDAELTWSRSAPSLHTELDLSIGACHLVDLRPGRRVRSLLVPGRAEHHCGGGRRPTGGGARGTPSQRESTPSPQVVVNLANRGVDGTSLTLLLNDLSLNVAYDPLLHLAAFLRPKVDVARAVPPPPLSPPADGSARAAPPGTAGELPPPPQTPSTTPPPPFGVSVGGRSSPSTAEARTAATLAAVQAPKVRYKVRLQRPRVAFWEDEASAASRVLVLQGLCIFDAKAAFDGATGRRLEHAVCRVEKLESKIFARGSHFLGTGGIGGVGGDCDGDGVPVAPGRDDYIVVGDRVEVRDRAEAWEAGTVAEVGGAGELRVVKDGYDTAFCWDEWRPLAVPRGGGGGCDEEVHDEHDDDEEEEEEEDDEEDEEDAAHGTGLAGVSLLEPLSLTVEVERSSQPLHPTTRTLNLSVEPVALRFSPSDVELLLALATQWTAASQATVAQAAKSASAVGGDGTAEAGDAAAGGDRCSGPTTAGSQRAAGGDAIGGVDGFEAMFGGGGAGGGDGSEYCVAFGESRLGLTLQRMRGSQLAFVEAVAVPQKEPSGGPADGDAEAEGARGGPEWACAACTFLNSHATAECAMCSTARMAADGGHGQWASAATGDEGRGTPCDQLPSDPPSPAPSERRVVPSVGDVIVAIGGDTVTRNTYETTISMLRTAARPLLITFRPPRPEESSGGANGTGGAASASSAAAGQRGLLPRLPGLGELDVLVRNRVSLDGLVLGKGGYGNMVVVRDASALHELAGVRGSDGDGPSQATQGAAGARSGAGGGAQRLRLAPRPGAVLVGVDGASVEGAGFERTVQLLRHADPAAGPNTPPHSPARGFSRVPEDRSGSAFSSATPPSPRASIFEPPSPLVLRFREVEAWSPRDTLKLDAAGLEALVMDAHGGDGGSQAALARVHVGLVSCTAELGPNLPWRWLGLGPGARGVRGVAACARLGIDFLNRRAGLWEPLLEPAGLRLEAEAEHRWTLLRPPNASAGAGPGAGVGADDGVGALNGSWGRGDAVLRLTTSEEINVNVTEAALEVLIATRGDWGGAVTNRAATSKRAAGKGVGKGVGKGNGVGIASLAAGGHKPYVFHNATGHDLRFCLAHPATAAAASAPPEGAPSGRAQRLRWRHVAAGGALPFAMHPSEHSGRDVAAEQLLQPQHYQHHQPQARPPQLSVSFGESVGFAPVRGLPLGRLGVRACSTTATSRSTGGGSIQVPMVWEVALVGGRHHLTLRAAVGLENNTGRPLEVAVPVQPGLVSSVGRCGDGGSDPAATLGSGPQLAWRCVVAAGTAVSLPLAVAATALLLVRPATTEALPGASSSSGGGHRVSYGWSEKSVLAAPPPQRPGDPHRVALTDPLRVRTAVLCRPAPDLAAPPVAAAALPAGISLATSPSLPHCPALLLAPGDSAPWDEPTALRKPPTPRTNHTAPSGNSAPAPAVPAPMHARALMVHAFSGAALRSLLPEPLEWSLRATSSRGATAQGAAARTVLFLGNGSLVGGGKRWLPQVLDVRRAEVQVKLGAFAWSPWQPFCAPALGACASGDARLAAGGTAAQRSPLGRLVLQDACGGVLALGCALEAVHGRAPTLVIFADYWLRNLSSLPLVFGTASVAAAGGGGGAGGDGSGGAHHQTSPPSAFGVASEHGAESGPRLGIGGCEARVCVAACQAPGVGVVVEMFEVAVADGRGAVQRNTTKWCDASGRALDPAAFGERLPSGEWAWLDNWALDLGGSGGRTLHSSGWETSASGSFATAAVGPRKFVASERFWRRRWVRTRVRRAACSNASGGGGGGGGGGGQSPGASPTASPEKGGCPDLDEGIMAHYRSYAPPVRFFFIFVNAPVSRSVQSLAARQPTWLICRCVVVLFFVACAGAVRRASPSSHCAARRQRGGRAGGACRALGHRGQRHHRHRGH